MTYSDLLNQRKIRRSRPSRSDIETALMSARERLDTAALDGVATDVRHNLAYDAARSAVQGVMLAEGYRSAMAAGHHQAMFEFLAIAVEGRWEREADYFDKARRKRNTSEYGGLGRISAKGADDILTTADEFVTEVHEWMRERGFDFQEE